LLAVVVAMPWVAEVLEGILKEPMLQVLLVETGAEFIQLLWALVVQGVLAAPERPVLIPQ
jgi:hypothetical protein